MSSRLLLFMPLLNVAESVYDSFRDSVLPIPGSVVYCDLAFGYMEHSGIYVGHNKIAHLAGSGDIELVSPERFLAGGSGRNIYVSCRGMNPVGAGYIARRAMSKVGSTRDYNFLLDNCHQFTAGCLSGDFENSNTLLHFLKSETKRLLHANTWRYWDL